MANDGQLMVDSGQQIGSCAHACFRRPLRYLGKMTSPLMIRCPFGGLTISHRAYAKAVIKIAIITSAGDRKEMVLNHIEQHEVIEGTQPLEVSSWIIEHSPKTQGRVVVIHSRTNRRASGGDGHCWLAAA